MKTANPVRYRLIVAIFLSLFGFTFVTQLIHPQTVQAVTNCAHWDRSVILCPGGQLFYDNQIDGNYTYVLQGDPDSCDDTIKKLTNNNTQATLHTSVPDPVNGGCKETTSGITLSLNAQSRMPFVYVDATHIITSDGKTSYTYNSALKLFVEVGGDKCKDTLKVIAGGPNGASATVQVIASTGGANTAYDKWAQELAFDKTKRQSISGCTKYTNVAANTYKVSTQFLKQPSIANPAIAGSNGGGSNGGTGDGSGGGGVNFDCEVRFWNPLTWILCPVVELLQGFLNWFDVQIDDMLEVNPNYIDTTKTEGKGFYQAWSSIRTIALVLIVIFGLVMIISQAVSVGPFDAYTIRKVLPRLVIATIGIALSWNLMITAINLTGDLGGSIRGILSAPFDNLTLPSLGQGATGIFAAGIGTFLIGTSFLGAVSLLLTAVLAVLIAFFVLIIRQIVIVLLIILAPIAIACYVLPNTSRVWKLWWESFSKALLMFPMIVALIVAGRIFAKVSAVDGDVLHQVIAFIAYFLPYFLIPATFRLAGGALSTIGGYVNNQGKGGFDRLKQFRQQQYKTTMDKNRGGNRLLGGRTDPTTGKAINFRGRINRGMQNSTLLPGAIAAGGVVRGVRDARGQVKAIRRTADFAAAQEIMKDPAFGMLGGNEHNMVGMLGTSRSDIITKLRSTDSYKDASDQDLNELADTIEQLQRVHGAKPLQIAAFMQKATSKNAFNEAGQMEREIAEVAGGDGILASNLIAHARSAQTQAGRADNVTAFGEQFGIVDDVMHNRIKIGERTEIDQETGKPKQVPIYDTTKNPEQVQAAAGQRVIRGALETTSPGQILGGTQRSVSNFMAELGRQWADAIDHGTVDEMTNVGARMATFRNAMGGATPQVREEVSKMLDSAGVNLDSDESSDQQLARRIADANISRSGTPLSETDRIKSTRTVMEEIRTKAGLYDMGNRELTPEERANQQMMMSGGQPPGTGIPPSGNPDER
ncbi:MAG TPA: hypothetical protein VLF39_04265 [Candidatus Saccharimonadales bacterium]|nr:hypothetical protein [Candidatus Saccharimonadales bacterium]